MEHLATVLFGSVERAPWGWALLGTVILALIKIWPQLQLQAVEARAKLRGERRDELTECHNRCEELAAQFDALKDHVHQLDLKLVGTVAAYRILHDELTGIDPENGALIQGRIVFRTHWDGAIPAGGVV